MKRIIPLTLLCVGLTHCGKKETAPAEKEPSTQAESSETSEHSFSTEEIALSTQKDAETNARELEKSLEFSKADDYLGRLSELFTSAQKENDYSAINAAFGLNTLDTEQLAQLKELLKNHAIDATTPFEQIGQITANKHARWAINLEDSDPIVLDVKRDSKGNWQLEKVVLPTTSANAASGAKPKLPNSDTDALNYTHSFLKSLLTQDFKKDRKSVV